jgi:hypothetical protein
MVFLAIGFLTVLYLTGALAYMTNAAAQGFLDLFFTNSAWANIGDTSGLQPSGTAGSFWISLHTAGPGVTGNQTTNETTYGGYTRIAVARSGSGWTRTAQTMSPTSTIIFPACTSGAATITHAGIGTASSGTGHLLSVGAVTPNIAVSTPIAPELTTASTFPVT